MICEKKKNELTPFLIFPCIVFRGEEVHKPSGCQICHIPYSESSVPFPTNLVRCNVCR